MGRRHLIVISVDALVYEDIADTKDLPLFGELIRNGSLTKNVRTIYPSLTHPVHASILTGHPAGSTGITANTVFTPGEKDMPWYNRLSEIQCKTIFDYTREAGLVTAVCHWPVTADAVDKIDYLVPELMAEDLKKAGGDVIKAFCDIGMNECLKDVMAAAIAKHGCSLSHPVCDEVQSECACEIVRRFKPDILFTHPGFVDSERHRTGLFSPYVTAAVRKTEAWIEALMQAAKDAGIYDDTDFIVLSDHGHLPYTKTVKLNRYLLDAGLIRTDPNGSVSDWDAYAQSCDLSAHLYLKRPDDEDLKKRVDKVIGSWLSNPGSGVGSCMDPVESEARCGLWGTFSYVLEAAEGFCFSDDWEGEAVTDAPPVEEGLGHSAHGHLPEKGPQPVFIGYGPDFEKGEIIEGGNVLNHFHTLIRLLGL